MLPIFALLIFFFPAAACGHEDGASGNVEIVERTGQSVPLDLTFIDEDGNTVTLRELVTKPTILTPVYYSCNDSCPLMLGALASAMGEIKLEPGMDYKVVTISIDKEDTPAIAKENKGNYIKASGIRVPADAWRFLTGTEENISRLTKAVGFSYRQTSGIGVPGTGSRKESQGYIHPTVLIFLAPDGKIIRYIYYGQSHYASLSHASFSPADLTLALNDAAKGRIRAGSINPIRLCFPGISRQQEVFYTLLSIVGALTLVCLAVFFIYLRKTGGHPAGGEGKRG
ncbi:MAG: SCO family protein [Syntrophobacteraceae bacterium]